MVDHAGGARRATERLLRLGHRRIALLTGNPSIYPARERIRGYIAAYEAAGVPVDKSLIRADSFLSDASFRETSALLNTANRPTAILAGGIDMLAGVIRAVRVHGLTIPDDVSVIGAGDSELAELHSPPISVVNWNQGTVGSTAATLLLNRIRRTGSDEPQHVLVESEYIERCSAAPPKTVISNEGREERDERAL
jgi:LacI family transcriptional regulator